MSLHIVFSRAHVRRVNMKSMILLLFLTVVASCAWAELEYHPQAVLHYLEMEDREMARKVRSIVKARGLPSGKPSLPPSFKPKGFPTGLPLKVVSIQYNNMSEQKEIISFPVNTIHLHLFGNFSQFLLFSLQKPARNFPGKSTAVKPKGLNEIVRFAISTKCLQELEF